MHVPDHDDRIPHSHEPNYMLLWCLDHAAHDHMFPNHKVMHTNFQIDQLCVNNNSSSKANKDLVWTPLECSMVPLCQFGKVRFRATISCRIQLYLTIYARVSPSSKRWDEQGPFLRSEEVNNDLA